MTAVDALFDQWLSAYEESLPSDRDLVAFVASLPAAQRRAAQVYARGFLRGWAFCERAERQRYEADLAAIETHLNAGVALVRRLSGGDREHG